MKLIAHAALLFWLFSIVSHAHAKDRATTYMTCFEGDHGMYLQISRDQQREFYARLSEVSFGGERFLEYFPGVNVNFHEDEFIPKETYNAINQGTENWFQFEISDPSGWQGRFYGDLEFKVYDTYKKVKVHCRKPAH